VDALVIIYKKWPNDARTNCKLTEKGITKYFCAKNKLLDEYENELQEQGYFQDE